MAGPVTRCACISRWRASTSTPARHDRGQGALLSISMQLGLPGHGQDVQGGVQLLGGELPALDVA
ncbi:MAG: hypothetical protein J2P19_08130, partial [Pseudonocardia sp.]|nr:hypothetical protein [Pseudonocardia sp.]